ncbi:L,D-transpeptidase family protein [Salinisphaera sp. SPP-AMP-43]|uniref:L,D-transpeptidase family protein n=1 Tax=Salinisphaera sp. SPP-AMP-43 TaxID=3121288 RepID=UPI003C6E044A
MTRGNKRPSHGLHKAAQGAAGSLLIVAVAACATATSPADTAHTQTDAAPTTSTTMAQGTTAPEVGQNGALQQSPLRQAMTQRTEMTGDNAAGTALKSFYADRDQRPVWFDDQGRITDRAVALVDYVGQIGRQGLLPTDYLDSSSAQRVTAEPPASPSDLADDEITLSQTFLILARDLHHGRVDDDSIRAQWPTPNKSVDYRQALSQASQGNPGDVLDALAPQQPAYKNLIGALAAYRKLEDNGGWPTIDDGPVLKQGMTDPRIAVLWQRLQVTGDAPAELSAPQQYDTVIMDAVRHYQKRNGLKTDGVFGPNTRKALNVPVTRRIEEIRVNLERWRWMPDSFGDRYIAVNVPDFSLRAVNGEQSLNMPVIVGGSYNDRATPIFGDMMRYLVFRPFWNVPAGIAADEIVPEVRKDPNYLASKNYQIVKRFSPDAQPMAVTPAHIDAVAAGKLHIRQAGGPNNALGLVKFIFPNKHAVYLHSTPADQLFNRTDRDLSHGCVRVADPEGLAAFVLSDKSAWSQQHIDSAMHTGQRQRVDLPEPIPVYLMYWTAFVKDNTVNFRSDLYDHDPKLDTALTATSAQST